MTDNENAIHANPHQPQQCTTTLLCLAAIAGLAILLLTLRLGSKSFWDDEIAAIVHARLPLDKDFLTADPYNPPLFFVLLHFWRGFSEEEAVLRLLPTTFGILSIIVLFLMVRRVAGSNSGLAAAFLLAVSPVFVLYSREVRPYSLLILCAIASTWLFHAGVFRGSGRGKRRGGVIVQAVYSPLSKGGEKDPPPFVKGGQGGISGPIVEGEKIPPGPPLEKGGDDGRTERLRGGFVVWLSYGLVSGAGLATHYSFAILFAVQTAVAVALCIFQRRSGSGGCAPIGAAAVGQTPAMGGVEGTGALWRTQWLFSLFVVCVTLLPWLPECAGSVELLLGRAVGEERLAVPYGVPGRLAYIGFVFGLGETLLPWRWVLVVPAAIGFAVLFLSGLFSLRRKGRAEFCLLLAQLLLTPLLFAVTSHGAPRYIFGSLPFFLAFCAVGVRGEDGLRSPSSCGMGILPMITHGRDARATPGHDARERRMPNMWPATRYGALVAVTVVSAVSLSNYFLGRDFHNMAYVEPTRETVALIESLAEPSDIVVLQPERRTFPFYLKGRLQEYCRTAGGKGLSVCRAPMCRGDSVTELPLENFMALVRRERLRVWVIWQSRGRMAGSPGVLERDKSFEAALKAGLHQRMFLQFCPDQEAPAKRRYVGKPFVDYRIRVALYD